MHDSMLITPKLAYIWGDLKEGNAAKSNGGFRQIPMAFE